MSDIEVEALDEELDEGELELSGFVEAMTDPDTWYAKNTFRVIYQRNDFLLPQIRDLISENRVINIRPEYQRRLRWRTRQKSRLIESLLLNIPIPPVFFFEGEAARYEVMDGQQRLSAVKEFMNNEFRLSGLDVLWPLNNLNYAEFPPRVKRGLDRAVISAVVLLLESDAELTGQSPQKQKDIRRFIFERLNTGGTRLNAQELRNAIYPGYFSDAVINISRGNLFTQIWGIPSYSDEDPEEYYENPRRQRNALYSSMADCQIVLRFFALRDDSNIRGSMKGILDRCMESGQVFTKEMARQAELEFNLRLKLSYDIFDGNPFQLPPDHKGKVRLSISLYDAVMIAVDRLWSRRSELLDNAFKIQAEIESLFSNAETTQIITGRGNTAQSIKDRISTIENAFLRAIEG